MVLKSERYGSYSTADSESTLKSLRGFMNRVYTNMAIGLLFTAAITLLALPLWSILSSTGALLVLCFAQIGLIVYYNSRALTMSTSSAWAVFLIYAGLTGLTLVPLIALAMSSVGPWVIVEAFAVSGVAFLVMSLYGHTTQRDLSAFGAFFFIALIGLLLACVVQMVLSLLGFNVTWLSILLNAVTVLIFAGLVAYETQGLKQMYVYQLSESQRANGAIYGALGLYMSFIAMFRAILMLFIHLNSDSE